MLKKLHVVIGVNVIFLYVYGINGGKQCKISSLKLAHAHTKQHYVYYYGSKK